MYITNRLPVPLYSIYISCVIFAEHRTFIIGTWISKYCALALMKQTALSANVCNQQCEFKKMAFTSFINYSLLIRTI